MKTDNNSKPHNLSQNSSPSRHGRMPNGKPNPIDVYAGSLIRKLRRQRGLSQNELGQKMGLTFQQIQKYECGNNRIGLSRLFDFCEVLQVEANYFLSNLPSEVSAQSPRKISSRPAS